MESRLLILTHAEVERLLPMADCIEQMAAAFAQLARGLAQVPLRMVVRPPGAPGLLALMPAYASAGFGLKTIGVFPGNVARGLDAHQGGVLLIDGETGALLALMNASAITAIRTAAVTALATRTLSREDARDLALIGASVQARTHLEALACVRRLERVRVASRDPEKARAFAQQQTARWGRTVEVCGRVEDAVRGADLITTVTSSAEPVLRRDWIAAGAHVNLVGASLPHAREADSATIAAGRLFVDRLESARNESGDYLIPLQEGAIGPDHIRGELGEVLIGARPGRGSPAEITLFKSLGLAIEDLAAARLVYERARQGGVGTWVDF